MAPKEVCMLSREDKAEPIKMQLYLICVQNGLNIYLLITRPTYNHIMAAAMFMMEKCIQFATRVAGAAAGAAVIGAAAFMMITLL